MFVMRNYSLNMAYLLWRDGHLLISFVFRAISKKSNILTPPDNFIFSWYSHCIIN
ncbi:hypothetical protein EMA8858_01331 [Emticicia aquatica]|uniref:Uncharacterized protein n=1 Tax=Emticicia aquatica TaxID=1681835 RepID=A0ABM9AN17_9BACT|nr:hypothetical protein EMA8858_01331 [Emticicia aquatica]